MVNFKSADQILNNANAFKALPANTMSDVLKGLNDVDFKKLLNRFDFNNFDFNKLRAVVLQLPDTMFKKVFDTLDSAKKQMFRTDPDLAKKIPGAKAADNVAGAGAKTVDDVANKAANDFYNLVKTDPNRANKMYKAKPEEFDEILLHGGLTKKQMSEIADTLGETFWGRYLGTNSWCAKNAAKCVAGLAGVGVGAYFLGDHIKSNQNEKKCRNDCFPKNWDEYVVVGIDKESLEYQTWDDEDKPVCDASMITDEKPYICNEYCKTACKQDSAIESVVSGAKDIASQGLLDLAEELGKLAREAAATAGDLGGNFLTGFFGEYWWAWLIGIFVALILGGVAIKRFMG